MFRVTLWLVSFAKLSSVSAKRLYLVRVPRTPVLVRVPSVSALCECRRWFCEGRWQRSDSEHQKTIEPPRQDRPLEDPKTSGPTPKTPEKNRFLDSISMDLSSGIDFGFHFEGAQNLFFFDRFE